MLRRKRQRNDAKPEDYAGPFIAWGGELHPRRLGPHFAVMGQNGSGKTLTIRMLLRSALLPEGELLHRTLVYDPKLDFYPVLRGLGVPPERIHVLNPFDARCESWDVAADIRTPAAAREFAALLLPREKGDHPYFGNTSRVILSEIINTLRERAGIDWTLNDLVQLVTSTKFLDLLTAGGPRARAVVESHLEKNARAARANLISTLHTGLVNYEAVAALWARSSKAPMRLERWMSPDEPPSVLLLGTYPEASESLNHINRAIFQRCAQLLRMKPEGCRDETWFILDEIRIAQELNSLPDLLLVARSKGGRFVLGFQDIHGLHDVYGEARAEELIAQCHNIGILRLSSPKTIEWASRYFGSDHWWTPSHGESWGMAGPGGSRSFSLQERRNILGSRFRALALPSPASGVEGIFATPYLRPWHAQLPPSYLDRYLVPEGNEPGVLRRASDDQTPPPCSAEILDLAGARHDSISGSQESSAGYTPSLPL